LGANDQPWRNWHGGFWATFVKLIAKDGVEKYWIRADVTRKDRLLQPGEFIVDGKSFSINQIDNPAAVYQRTGITNRDVPLSAPLHGYYDLSDEMIKAATDGNAIAVIINCQQRSGIKLELSPKRLADLKQLISLKYKDYAEMTRKQ